MNRPYVFLLTAMVLLVASAGAWAAQTMVVDVPHFREVQPRFDADQTNDKLTRVSWTMSELRLATDDEGRLAFETNGPRMIEQEGALPVHGGLVYLPWGRTGAATATGGTFHRLLDNGTLLPTDLAGSGLSADDFVSLGGSGIFRDITVAPLNITPVLEGSDGHFYVASDLNVDVQTVGVMDDVPARDPQRKVSRAFAPLYESMLLNDLDELGLHLADTKGSYLVITGEGEGGNLATLESSGWVNWKRQKGYNVVIESWDITQTGISHDDLSTMISDAYETLDPPLEYVLLVGDVNRGDTNARIPAVTIENPNYDETDVTDWPITHLQGNDYFPEVMVGRLPVSGQLETYRAASRVVNYERNFANIPTDHAYWHSAALVAANWSEGGLTPLTPVAITEWVEERMLESWGFDTVYDLYWEQGGEQATAQEIRTAIDAGVLWVSYRGWGNAQGWEEPDFDIGDVESLNNANMLPVLTSFVCNTGDFGNNTAPKCFAEYWITAGSTTIPTGAVAAIAPTDLHTNTRYNNSLVAGYYHGVYDEGLRNISNALQRAKHELYLGFPLERNTGQEVEFYYHVYHVLGDPELTMWTRAPWEISVDAPDEVAVGQGTLTVTLTGPGGPVSGAYVQAMQDGAMLGGAFADEGGVASVRIQGAVAGELDVTVTRADYFAEELTIPVTQENVYVGVEDWSVNAGGDGLVSRMETVDLTVTLTNSGTTNLTNVTATLSHPDDEMVSILEGSADFGAISAGGQSDNSGSPFQFRLDGHVTDGQSLEFDLTITAGANTFNGKVWTVVGSQVWQYVGYENTGGNDFAPGETASLRFEFANNGSIDLSNLTATLTSYDDAVTDISGSVSGIDIAAGESAWVGPFDITVSSETFRGRPVALRLSFTDGSGESYGTRIFNVALEGASSTDPYGPDAYGYYVYDNTDTNDEAPEYQWFNLDEDANVDNHFQLFDDQNVVTTLPIDVRYYGELYPAGTPLTISSNGWVSLHAEEQYTQYFFRNWQLPSTIGPWVLIAPFWDDLGPQLGNQQANVYTKYDAENGRLIIEWSDTISRFSNLETFPAYFALVIYDPDAMLTETGDSVIEMYYEDVENVDQRNNYATVGVEKPDKTTGLQYTYASVYPTACAPLEAGRAIRFTTNTPDGLSEITEPVGDSTLPGEFTLYPVQPNPFNSSTVISFDLPEGGDVRLSIYNLLGQEIANLVDRQMQAGHKEVVWQVNDRGLSSGMLLIRLEASGQEMWGKMMYVK